MINEKELIAFIQQASGSVSQKELIRAFRIGSNERREFRRVLRHLEEQGRIQRVRGKNFTAVSGGAGKRGVVGRLQVARKGFGFVRPDWTDAAGGPAFEGDLFIPPRSMGAALDGDLVRAEMVRKEEEGHSGRIIEILEHAHRRIVGQYQQTSKRGGEILARNQKIDRRIKVPLPDPELGIKNYDWVSAEIRDFPTPPAPLQGIVRERLGQEGDKGIDVLLVLRDLGIFEEFPDAVEQQAAALDFHWKKDLKGRKDYRKLPTITIDPKTAKDFDDALSIEKRPRGGWKLYVHIADVCHFLEARTPLDDEARDRATSVYPVDRVVPMLPEKLSNNLCSLVPHQDRLTMTAAMNLTKKGKIQSASFHSSVIHSDHRMTYEQVQAIFDGDKETAAQFADVGEEIAELRACAAVLREARFDRGALDLDIPESKVIFDDDGKAIDIKFYERFEAHMLVEECMLIANEAVAQHLTRKEAPMLYRVHEMADQERLERIIPILEAFGIRLESKTGEIGPKDLQDALDQAQQLEAGHVLRRYVLRALRRAEYDPENAGHFGLASDCYCHFTSPIRRYPDVVVHRQLKALEQPGDELFYSREENDLDVLGEHCSMRERRAQEAEWESTAIKGIEFMEQYTGHEFEAFIIGVHSYGMFLELVEYPVEGFVKVKSLKGDYFDLDELGIMLKGRNTGRTYRVGDKVEVRIERCDPMAQEMDLAILGADDDPFAKPKRNPLEEPKRKKSRKSKKERKNRR